MKDAVLARDCDVIRIPAGDHVTLPKGTELMITQSLGGSFTVQVPAQGLFRISGKDAEAIGEEVPAETLMLDGIEGAVEERPTVLPQGPESAGVGPSIEAQRSLGCLVFLEREADRHGQLGVEQEHARQRRPRKTNSLDLRGHRLRVGGRD